jgi:dipeptidyl aminopeptidase/acylaminoacyl peptidase
MPGYRGHGVIDGEKAAGLEYFKEYSPLHLATSFYAVDVLNMLAGLSSLELPQDGSHKTNLIDPANLFLAAHSMGGDVALKVLAVTDLFRAASIWAGVCASIEDVAAFYAKYEIDESKSEKPLETAIREINEKIQRAVSAEPFLLDKASETNGCFYLENITAPVILHQGTGDYAVDPNWSVALYEKLKKLGKDSTLYLYEGNDHELSLNDEHHLAIERDVAFFKDHLKKEK